MMSRRREEGRSEGDALIAIIGRTLQNRKPHFWLKAKEQKIVKKNKLSYCRSNWLYNPQSRTANKIRFMYFLK